MKTIFKNIKKTLPELVLEVLSLFTIVFLMAFFWQYNTVLTVIFISTFLLILPFLKEKSDILLFIFATVFFQIGEIILAYSGAWTYNNPSYLGIPVWISLSWGFSALIIKKLSQTINKLLEKN